MKILLIIFLISFATILTAQPYYLAGDFQGWNPSSVEMNDSGTDGDLAAGDGIYSLEYTVTDAGFHGWKVTNGTWDVTSPSSDSWFSTSNANEKILFTFDTNAKEDGWLPNVNIVNTNEVKPTEVVAVGDWQSEVGESGDWTNNSNITKMLDDGQGADLKAGDGIFSYHIQGLPVGNYQAKCVKFGEWNGWGNDGRSQDAKNIEFTTTTDNQDVFVYVDVNSGRLALTLDLPIPVELTFFNAISVNQNVNLTWQTATEINNERFLIERKTKTSDYTNIASIQGNGTTSQVSSYNYIDENLAAETYLYRLKQIDFDGTFSYSDEIEVTIEIPLAYKLSQNYPNPFNPSTKISYSLMTDQFVSLKVYDIIGSELATLVNGVMKAGNYEINFDASKLTSGVYIYKLTTPNFTSTKKMMLLR